MSKKSMLADLRSRLRTVVDQACVRMNDAISKIREVGVEQPRFFEHQANLHGLVEVVFGTSTALYYLSKWCGELSSENLPPPMKPTRLAEAPRVDVLLSQLQCTVAKIEVETAKLDSLFAQEIRTRKISLAIGVVSVSTPRRTQRRDEELLLFVSHLEYLLASLQTISHPERISSCTKPPCVEDAMAPTAAVQLICPPDLKYRKAQCFKSCNSAATSTTASSMASSRSATPRYESLELTVL